MTTIAPIEPHSQLFFTPFKSKRAVVNVAAADIAAIATMKLFQNNLFICLSLNSFFDFVVIKHNHGIYTRYAHLNNYRVQKGQLVEQGDIIGYVGNTGVSTGPHLHYEVHIGSDVVDPAKYINIKLTNK